MADEWIRVRLSLLTSPKLAAIARDLEAGGALHIAPTDSDPVTRDVTHTRYAHAVTLVSVMRVWNAANEHTQDGVFANATLENLDNIASMPGLGAAMAAAGWANYDENLHTVTLPNFNEYNTSAKKRDPTNAERQRRYRERQRLAQRDALEHVTSNVTRRVTSDDREEKRRLDLKSKSITSTAPQKPAAIDQPPATPAAATKVINGHEPEPRPSVDAVIELWHELMPDLPRVRVITAARRTTIATRIRQDLPTEKHWRRYFAYIRTVPFLMGHAPPTPGHARPFRPTLLWFCKPENFAKVSEDFYDARL